MEKKFLIDYKVMLADDVRVIAGCLVVNLATSYCATYLAGYTWRGMGGKEWRKLPDKIHDILPENYDVYDAMECSALALLLLAGYQNINVETLKRGVIVVTYALTLRAILVAINTLPDASCNCGDGKPKMFGGSCGDLMYSGHQVTYTIAAYFLIPRSLLLPALTLYGLSILGKRKHYTMDVVIASYIGCTLPGVLRSMRCLY